MRHSRSESSGGHRATDPADRPTAAARRLRILSRAGWGIAMALVLLPGPSSAQRIELHGKEAAKPRSSQDSSGGGSVTVGVDADEGGARIVIHGDDGDSTSIRFDARFDRGRDARPGDEPPAGGDEDRLPHASSTSRTDERISFGSDILIPREMSVAGDVVAILGSIKVHGVVRGQVVSIGGNIELGPEAQVGGEAVSIGGNIKLESGAIVRGEVVAIGGRIREEEGALIGERIELNIIPTFGLGGGFAGISLFLYLGQLLFVAIAALIMLQISVRRWETSSLTLKVRGWESLLAGVGGGIVYLILLLPLLTVAMVALAAIVIGIPLIPVVALLLLIFPIPGYLIAGLLLGLTVMGRHPELEGAPAAHAQVPPSRPMSGLGRAFLLGHLLLSLPGLVGIILGLAGTSGVVTILFMAIGWAVMFLAIALGWGAFLLSRFGRRPPSDGLPGTSPAPHPAAPRSEA